MGEVGKVGEGEGRGLGQGVDSERGRVRKHIARGTSPIEARGQ